MKDIIVSDLRIHPIKGFKRTLIQDMPITKTGPLNDRRFMVIDENNQFLSQRTCPLMATIDVRVSEREISLQVPGYDPVVFDGADGALSEPFSGIIWKDTVSVVEPSPQASHLLETYLQTPCRLVGMAPQSRRLLSPTYAKRGTEEVLFADAFPFLLISQASLDDLNRRLEVPVPMDRFRPNIVVSGCDPYEEDQWETIQIGEIVFDLPKLCSRCLVTTVDQETGVREKERGKNPLKILAQYRNSEKGIMFGKNMIHRSIGSVAVGQQVTVLN